MGINKINWKWLEKDWLRNQVETHLIFSIFAKYIPFGIIMFVIIVANAVETLINSNETVLFVIYDNIFLLIVTILVLLLPRLQQATLGWIVTKILIGVLAFLLMTVGAGSSWRAGRNDVIPNLLLGIIWIPWIEFLPKVTPKQKYITLARIVLSIPVIYMGIQSGDWHWR